MQQKQIIVNVPEVEINEIIKNLYLKRPAGLNKISPKMVKRFAKVIDSSIKNIIKNDITNNIDNCQTQR